MSDLKKLELDKILLKLSGFAVSEDCRERLLSIEPFYDKAQVIQALQKTDDAFILSARYGTPGFSKIVNIETISKRSQSGAALSLRELSDTLAVLRQISSLMVWYNQNAKQLEDEYYKDSLREYFEQLIVNKTLSDTLANAIGTDNELSDNASPELARIRRAIDRKGLLIRQELEKLTKSSQKQKYLQEALVTMRDGRYVVPVKSEYKSEITGLVHDVSSSGATFFIEPMSVVEANNEIRVLKSKEQDEIERIIRELSAMVGEFAELLSLGYEAVIQLEMCFAKSSLGAKMRGTIPVIVDDSLIDFKRARHPLIAFGDTPPVPVSINLGESYKALVVTGPNTGGKTVVIKTAGLLTLMAQCGLMLPADSGSRMGVFTKVLADLGDEQSIEQSLSTFSSHMNNIIGIIAAADEKSLILLDELGSGTDPVEGAALAVAIIEKIKSKNAIMLATTHYQELKLYAIETEGVENAACEFDVNTLKPTYKLIVGAPGKSNAFEIAQRLGLPDEIIAKAKERITGENQRFENVIEELQTTGRELERLKEEAASEKQKSEKLRLKLQKLHDEAEKNKDRELQNVRNRSQAIINQAQFTAEKLIAELEELKAQKDKADFSEKVRRIDSKVEKGLDEIYEIAYKKENKRDYKPPRPIKLYDTVILVDINKKGTVIKEPDNKGNCLVQVGIMKTKTNIKNLELVLEEPEKSPSIKAFIKTDNFITTGAKSSQLELDVRGMTADEAIIQTDKFIDNSIISGFQTVTIIHGKGTGVLRAAVHKYLKGHKRIAKFRLGEYGEGDSGVTVVTVDN
ncbi:MAG: endonuclease MutS2 [Oscillospiraceae bacterium]|nr:endonuclease MutS2 [Oscillospiraceae bacterium]